MKLRDSLKRASARLLGDEPKDNKIVRYRGVSLNFLDKLMQDILNENVSREVQLLLITRDVQVQVLQSKENVILKAGATVRFKSKVEENGGVMMRCDAPYIGTFDLQHEQDYELKPRKQWTIEDVCEYVVLEQTRAKKAFYLDLLPQADVGKRFQGVFVSQARKSYFMDLVESLLHRFERTEFVWLDIFSANQPLLTARDGSLPKEVQKHQQELLKFGLHDAICRFEDRVIFFNSWSNPYPLERAWCVWEIFGCVKSEKPLDILFRRDEHKAFAEALLEHRDLKDRYEVAKQIATLRLENAACFVKKDKHDIDAAVGEQIGYHRLNVTISKLVNEWFRNFVGFVIDENREKNEEEHFSRILFECGMLLSKQFGEHDEARERFEECLAIQERIYVGRENKEVAMTLQEMACVLEEKSEYEMALKLYEESLEIEEKIYGGRDQETTASTLDRIASVLDAKGDYDTALQLFYEVLQIYEKIFGGRNHRLVAVTFNNLGLVLNNKGEYGAALKRFQEALEIYETIYGSRDHPDVPGVLNNMASLYFRQGNYDAALKLFEEALQIKERIFGGREHPDVAATMNNIAMVLNSKGETEAAMKLFKEELHIYEKIYNGRAHPSVSTLLNNMALLFYQSGQHDEALKLFQESLQICDKVYGDRNHPSVAQTLQNTASVFYQKGEFKQALSLFQQALQIYKKFYDRSHPDIVTTLKWIKLTEAKLQR